MAYQILYNEIRMGKYIVQIILNYIPKKMLIYTDECYVHEHHGDEVCAYIPSRQYRLEEATFYKIVYGDCLELITYRINKKNNV